MVEYYAANAPLTEPLTAREVARRRRFWRRRWKRRDYRTTIYVDKGYHAMGRRWDAGLGEGLGPWGSRWKVPSPQPLRP